ncbi:MAG: hypothetical protein RR674_08880 [Anaerorhabdus sp.]
MTAYNSMEVLANAANYIYFALIMFFLVILVTTYLTYRYPTVIKGLGITISLLSGLGMCSLIIFLGFLADEAGACQEIFNNSIMAKLSGGSLILGILLGIMQIYILAKNTKIR